MKELLCLFGALFSALLSFSTASAQCVQQGLVSEVTANELRSCDLLFVVNHKGNAITQSTTRSGSLPIDHVAIVLREGDSLWVYEAVPGKGVSHTTLSHFAYDYLRRSDPSYAIAVGRVASSLLDTIATKERFTQITAPYDSLYLPDDSAYYCSELVQKTFVDHQGSLIFPTIPMSFHNEAGEVLPYWKRFYAQHGMDVPEGAPGTNPNQIAHSPQVSLIGYLKEDL